MPQLSAIADAKVRKVFKPANVLPEKFTHFVDISPHGGFMAPHGTAIGAHRHPVQLPIELLLSYPMRYSRLVVSNDEPTPHSDSILQQRAEGRCGRRAISGKIGQSGRMQRIHKALIINCGWQGGATAVALRRRGDGEAYGEPVPQRRDGDGAAA